MLKASFWPTHGCSAAGHCCCLQNVRHCSRGRVKNAALLKQSCGLLLPRSRSMIALPESGGISRFLESLMCLRAPLCAQGFWPTHECRAAGRALKHLLTYCVSLQQGPCGICSTVRTDFRAPAATPPQQEPSGIGSMMLGIKALAYVLCDTAAGAVRNMQHCSNRLSGSCCHAPAAGAERNRQHDCFARWWWDFQIP